MYLSRKKKLGKSDNLFWRKWALDIKVLGIGNAGKNEAFQYLMVISAKQPEEHFLFTTINETNIHPSRKESL